MHNVSVSFVLLDVDDSYTRDEIRDDVREWVPMPVDGLFVGEYIQGGDADAALDRISDFVQSMVAVFDADDEGIWDAINLLREKLR